MQPQNRNCQDERLTYPVRVRSDELSNCSLNYSLSILILVIACCFRDQYKRQRETKRTHRSILF